MDFGKIFMRQGVPLGNVLCDRVQGVERFATHPHHFPSQVPPRDHLPIKKGLRQAGPIDRSPDYVTHLRARNASWELYLTRDQLFVFFFGYRTELYIYLEIHSEIAKKSWKILHLQLTSTSLVFFQNSCTWTGASEREENKDSPQNSGEMRPKMFGIEDETFEHEIRSLSLLSSFNAEKIYDRMIKSSITMS